MRSFESASFCYSSYAHCWLITTDCLHWRVHSLARLYIQFKLLKNASQTRLTWLWRRRDRIIMKCETFINYTSKANINTIDSSGCLLFIILLLIWFHITTSNRHNSTKQCVKKHPFINDISLYKSLFAYQTVSIIKLISVITILHYMCIITYYISTF